MSETLELIMKHWTAPLPTDPGIVDLPFNLEEFCREMDERLDALLEQIDSLQGY